MKLLFMVIVLACYFTCMGQNRRLIPGLIPLALKKGGFELSAGMNYDAYSKEHQSGVAALFQSTYGIFNWFNVGIDAAAYSMRYSIEDTGVVYDIRYRSVSVGPRIRWGVYNHESGLFNITAQNSILFPFTKIKTSSGLGPDGQKNISNGPVFNNQITFLLRTGYHLIFTLDAYLVVYPGTEIDEKKPIDIPVNFLASYAIKTNWMVHGILSDISEFRTVSWDSGTSYYLTAHTLKVGLGIQYSVARGFSVNATGLLPAYSHRDLPTWSDSKTINLAFRWRP